MCPTNAWRKFNNGPRRITQLVGNSRSFKARIGNYPLYMCPVRTRLNECERMHHKCTPCVKQQRVQVHTCEEYRTTNVALARCSRATKGINENSIETSGYASEMTLIDNRYVQHLRSPRTQNEACDLIWRPLWRPNPQESFKGPPTQREYYGGPHCRASSKLNHI